MNLFKTTSKTNLVQSLEEMQEDNEMIAILEDYINYINSSMAVPYDVLKGGNETSIAMFPDKPTLIKIDVTKY